MGTHIILRGATQAAGLALDALPAVGAHGRRHVHRELQARGVSWGPGGRGAVSSRHAPGGSAPTPWLTRPDPAQPTVPRARSAGSAAPATSLLPGHHGNHTLLPRTPWQPHSITHGAVATTFYHPQHRGSHVLLTAVLRQPHSISHSRVANPFP